MNWMDYAINDLRITRKRAINDDGNDVSEGESQSDEAIRMLSQGIEPLSALDISALELYILQTYRRLNCINATRDKVFRTYANTPTHREFNNEIQRIFADLKTQIRAHERKL